MPVRNNVVSWRTGRDDSVYIASHFLHPVCCSAMTDHTARQCSTGYAIFVISMESPWKVFWSDDSPPTVPPLSQQTKDCQASWRRVDLISPDGEISGETHLYSGNIRGSDAWHVDEGPECCGVAVK